MKGKFLDTESRRAASAGGPPAHGKSIEIRSSRVTKEALGLPKCEGSMQTVSSLSIIRER